MLFREFSNQGWLLLIMMGCFIFFSKYYTVLYKKLLQFQEKYKQPFKRSIILIESFLEPQIIAFSSFSNSFQILFYLVYQLNPFDQTLKFYQIQTTIKRFMVLRNIVASLVLIIVILGLARACDNCFKPQYNDNCKEDPNNIDYYTMHMSVHPHLDAFWIFNFQSYYNPGPNQYQVQSYFGQNRFNSVKQIFDTATEVLWQSKNFRQQKGSKSQRAHRSFFNSEMGFFKRWYFQQPSEKQLKVKQILKTKYWEIVGGGIVEHDQGCAYYDDIIENYQMGLRFLKENFGYYPRAAVSADSFGHSQTTLAILAHIGVQGYFVQRSDEHILLQNKTEFIWKAKSANGKYYGALPTHIRWAIHGFEDQFVAGDVNQKICNAKSMYIDNMRRQNEFLKRILKSNHIMRYFGHDFQRFNNYSYTVIQGIMEEFSRQKCPKLFAVYGNPSQYFQILMGEVWNKKVKPIATREEDIMPIWDYDSGLYWTGYYTTDPYHKKDYRDAGRLLHLLRKAFLPIYIANPKQEVSIQNYDTLERLAEQVAYAQHHDGISGTSKYTVMDSLQKTIDNHFNNVTKQLMNQVFEEEFPINTNNPVFHCEMEADCSIPANIRGDIYLKIFNSAADRKGEPIKINLPFNEYYKPNCAYQVNCLCYRLPCECTLYLFPKLLTYTPILLKKVQQSEIGTISLLQKMDKSDNFSFNNTHFNIVFNEKMYGIGYKKIAGDATARNYDHLSRYGDKSPRGFTIRSGKYALGNDPNKVSDFSKISKVHTLDSPKLKIFIIKWAREHMKTIITINKAKMNQWKVQTHSSAEGPTIQDIYLQIGTPIANQKKFYTDSNGWLVMERTLFHHQDYNAHFDPRKYDDIDGNSYPMSAFVYLQKGNQKVSVNTDRPQGVIAYKDGTLWVNFDRLSTDDGKWVYETTYRNQYQKFTHWITVDNTDNNQRKIQSLYDQPIYMQGNLVLPNQKIQQLNKDFALRDKWAAVSGIDNVKMLIKPWNDTTVTLRIHNLNDQQTRTVGLFSGQISPILTAYYGNQIKFKSLEQSSLGGNMNYQKFLNNKWNWGEVVDLSAENSIFNKIFRENITLRPLQIRTFTFQGLQIVTQCQSPDNLKYSGAQIEMKLNTTKPMNLRDSSSRQSQIASYLLNENHCESPSPVLMLDPNFKPGSEPIIKDTIHNLPEFKFISQTNPQKTPNYQPKLQDNQRNKPIPQNQNKKNTDPTQHKASNDPIKPKNPYTLASQNQLKDFEVINGKVNKLEKLSRQQKFTYFKVKHEQILRTIKLIKDTEKQLQSIKNA